MARKPLMINVVQIETAELGFDLGRCAAGSSVVGDDLLQVFDAVTPEGGHAVFADAIDPKAANHSGGLLHL